ncbi:LpqB family beta-propeller domain-containing protein [Haematomicrobium sanguinis]|uniref:LpqB family beta-propeller domain-containing protein n=1 Tax=Haematomicrobium sanguinis TaxID=479106 RepID=UPI0004799428|nr:LpqB family beta-propeller domain-containing protein [Haematomicrobium sanguinis]
MTRSRLLAILVGVFALILVSGCSTIPTSGPIGTNKATGGQSAPPPVIDAQAPQDGATAEDIVRGFINAGANTRDDFETARLYLSSKLAETWKPGAKTTLYASDYTVKSGAAAQRSTAERPTATAESTPTASEPTATTATVEFQIAGQIDANGIKTSNGRGTEAELPVQLVREDGQWRISKIDDGLIIGEMFANQIFQPQYLYFYNSSFTTMVPDTRWFLSRPSVIAGSMVQALLKGPAPYLQGAVVSAFPDGSTIGVNSVPINSGQAVVELPEDLLAGASPQTVRHMVQQLQFTLQGLSSVTSVMLTVNGVEVRAGTPAGFTPATSSVSVGTTMVGTSKDNRLVTVTGSSVDPLEGLDVVRELQPRKPAMSYDGQNFAFLGPNAANLYAVTTQKTYAPAVQGKALTAPSFNQVSVNSAIQNWVWTTSRDGDTEVMAARVDDAIDQPVKVSAPWISNLKVTDFRVSPDGSRALIGAMSDGTLRILISGIVRDGNGAPRSLTEPIELTTREGQAQVRWSGLTDILTLGTDPENEGVPERIRLDNADSEYFQGIANASAITSGNGANEIYVSTDTSVMLLSGSKWEVFAKDVTQAAFPG